MQALPSFNVHALTDLDEALAATEGQVRALAEYVRQCDRLSVDDRKVLVANIEWLRFYYAQIERICLNRLN